MIDADKNRLLKTIGSGNWFRYGKGWTSVGATWHGEDCWSTTVDVATFNKIKQFMIDEGLWEEDE